MKSALTFIALTMAANVAIADVDYTRCNMVGSFAGARLDHDGKLEVAPWQKIKNIETKGKVEKYVIENDGGATFGAMMPGNSKSEITIERDDQGRVIRMQTGPDTLDKKSIASIQKAQLYFQLNGTVYQTDLANNNTGFAPGTMTHEPVFHVKGENDKYSYVKMSSLTKEQRKEAGLLKDVYKDIKQKWRRDKKTVAKLEKGLQEMQAKSHPVYPIGQEANFEIKDGVCTPKDMSNRMFHSRDSSVHKNVTFTKEACEEVATLYLKHKEKISKCDEASKEMTQDIWSNGSKIQTLTQGGMFGYGGGGYGGGIGGGFGGVGLQISTLSSLKNHCDMMIGQFNFGMGSSNAQKNDSKGNGTTGVQSGKVE